VRVFLSYRRGEAGGHAGRLNDGLLERLGPKNVFQDVGIAPGANFIREIDRELDACDVAIAVIGPGWLTAANEQGGPRLFEPDDFVRQELAHALQRDVPVIPVLVGRATLPAAAELPEDLRLLSQHQAVELHDESWHEDLEGLVRRLRGKPARSRKRSRGIVAGAVVGAVAVVGGAAWWLLAADDDDKDSEDATETTPLCGSAGGEGFTTLPLDDDPYGEYQMDTGPLVFGVIDAGFRELESGNYLVTLRTTMENDTTAEQYHGDWYYKDLAVAQRPYPLTCFTPEQELVDPGRISEARVGFEVTCPPVGYIELALGDEGERIDVTSESQEPSAC
jgi:TIR domain